MDDLNEVEKELLAQALADYREGIEDNCDDSDLRERLIEILDTLEQKLEI